MKWLARVFAALGALVLSVVLVQGWYYFTPVELSTEAKALNERAARLPAVTDNGYRLYGFFAPRELDPVAYGRCVVAAPRQGVATAGRDDDQTALFRTLPERRARKVDTCRNGGTPLDLPQSLEMTTIELASTREKLRRLASLPFDPVLEERAERIWAGEPRIVGASQAVPASEASALRAIARSRVARAAVAWDQGNRATAVAAWAAAIRDAVNSADDSLFEASVSTTDLAAMLVVVQQSVAMTSALDEPVAMALFSALAPLEAMPQAVADSFDAEWRATLEQLDMTRRSMSEGSPEGGAAPAYKRALLAVLYDHVDSTNAKAHVNFWARQAVFDAAQGALARTTLDDAAAQRSTAHCTPLYPLCLPYIRNVGGRITSGMSAPFYADYGVRVADLLTLVNATRLTITARRLGLTGAALENWVAAAPLGMRPVGSEHPFRYDSAQRKLFVELRAKSTILGDAGTYALPL